MPARKFFYFFYGDLIPSGLPPGDDPRRFLSHRADGILSAVLEAGPSGLGYREACVRYSAGLVDGLIRAGLFRVEAGGLRLDAPVFLREDAGALTHFLAGEIPPLAGRLEAALPALHAAICPLDNGFDEKVNLYHLLCGAVLDGTFFDYLSARGVLAESRVHPSGLDYILTVYEDAPELNHFSNRLLCSCNRLSDGRRSLQSFGDADGERLDFYRFLTGSRQDGCRRHTGRSGRTGMRHWARRPGKARCPRYWMRRNSLRQAAIARRRFYGCWRILGIAQAAHTASRFTGGKRRRCCSSFLRPCPDASGKRPGSCWRVRGFTPLSAFSPTAFPGRRPPTNCTISYSAY